MKSALPLLAAFMLIFVSSQAIAQSQADQEACEGDVYDLCAEKIPDEDEIVACLRKQWRKVSKECRHVMISYKKKQSRTKRKDANQASSSDIVD